MHHRHTLGRTHLLAWAIALSAPCAANAGYTFSGLGFLPGSSNSVAYDVSGDGSTIVGRSANQAYYWTGSTGMVAIGPFSSEAISVSRDGSVIVGLTRTISNPPPNFASEAFRWTAREGLVGLGDLPGGGFGSQARGVSSDGGVIVGRGDVTGIGATVFHPFRWTEQSGFQDLGSFSPLKSTLALGVSGDGSTVVGFGHTALGTEAFRWTAASGLVSLGDLPGGGSVRSQARAVSEDGSVIVGYGDSTLADQEPFRWTAAEGMVGLGVLPGFVGGTAEDLTADGSIIVGGSGQHGGFIWDEQHGMLNLMDYLIDGGADLDGWTSLSASGVSADGGVIVGTGFHQGNIEAWVATVPEPATLAYLVLAATACLHRHRRGDWGRTATSRPTVLLSYTYSDATAIP